MVDTRRHFKENWSWAARNLRVQPGATIMMVNNYLAPYGYKLGPDPHLGPPAPSVAWSHDALHGMSSGANFNTLPA